MTHTVVRDERELGIDLAADRLSFLVLAYGVLAAVAIRSFGGETSWDLLALVALAGAAGLVYRRWHRAVSRSWFVVAVATTIAVALLAAVVASQLLR